MLDLILIFKAYVSIRTPSAGTFCPDARRPMLILLHHSDSIDLSVISHGVQVDYEAQKGSWNPHNRFGIEDKSAINPQGECLGYPYIS